MSSKPILQFTFVFANFSLLLFSKICSNLLNWITWIMQNHKVMLHSEGLGGPVSLTCLTRCYLAFVLDLVWSWGRSINALHQYYKLLLVAANKCSYQSYGSISKLYVKLSNSKSVLFIHQKYLHGLHRLSKCFVHCVCIDACHYFSCLNQSMFRCQSKRGILPTFIIVKKLTSCLT